jgi:transcriptional regulator NrdR family protein
MAGTCRCPECNHRISRVVQSHEQRDGQMVRRRKCGLCGHQWFTVQPPEEVLDRERVRYQDRRPMLRRAGCAD